MRPALLTAALTGPIATKADNPALPTTPEEIATAARESWEAGASVAHVHLRDREGRPTADLAIAERTIDAVRRECPVRIQLSTGVGLGVPFEARERLVEACPEMATLNVCSMTFGDSEFSNPPDSVRRLAARMAELGVKPELEVYDLGHVEMAATLHAEGLLADPVQVSLVMGVRGGMPADASTLEHVVGRLPREWVWQVIAIGRANLPLTAIGLALGGNARTGMEDTLLLRRGEPVSGNRELVERLAALARSLDRPPADVDDASSLLGLRQQAAAGGASGAAR